MSLSTEDGIEYVERHGCQPALAWRV